MHAQWSIMATRNAVVAESVVTGASTHLAFLNFVFVLIFGGAQTDGRLVCSHRTYRREERKNARKTSREREEGQGVAV
ncbi:hypothetical protein C8R45DRAFT_1047315 [Mycena sanguinolenta]|nr:hypothetical protein C8R45DRAFT_1047315 [Mycena sanguinolenta]